MPSVAQRRSSPHTVLATHLGLQQLGSPSLPGTRHCDRGSLLLCRCRAPFRVAFSGRKQTQYSHTFEAMGQLSLLSMRASIIPERNQLAIVEHQAILDALEARDADAAVAAMEAHMEAVKKRSIADLEGGMR